MRPLTICSLFSRFKFPLLVRNVCIFPKPRVEGATGTRRAFLVGGLRGGSYRLCEVSTSRLYRKLLGGCLHPRRYRWRRVESRGGSEGVVGAGRCMRTTGSGSLWPARYVALQEAVYLVHVAGILQDTPPLPLDSARLGLKFVRDNGLSWRSGGESPWNSAQFRN